MRSPLPGAYFDAAFSADGALVAAAHSQSLISVWKTDNIIDASDRQADPLQYCQAKPDVQLNASAGPIYSVIFADQFLISAADFHIHVWDLSCQDAISVLTNPRLGSRLGDQAVVAETNGLAFCAERKILYSASGDGIAYQWDLATGSTVTKFEGHSDFLHCICLGPRPNTLLTGSEDGTVRLWDTRTTESQIVHQPKTKEWIGSISCKNDIIVAGSGLGHLYTYHAGSQSLLQTFRANAPVQAIEQDGYDIISAGRESSVNTWNSDGSIKLRINTPAESIFSLKLNPVRGSRLKMVSSGARNMLSFFTDLTLPPSVIMEYVSLI